MKYTIYKITNNLDGKIYIGCHKTKDINDDYMGSGKYLRHAVSKYGLEHFTKEILEVFDNPEDMFDMESQLVNDDFVKRTDTYNLKEGGSGGFDHIDNSGQNNPMYGKPSPCGMRGKTHSIEQRQNNSLRMKHLIKEGKFKTDTFTGKTHTERTKRKIGEANSKHQSGKGNSNFGNCWIYHPELKKSKPIPRYELSQWESEGWLKGRKIKF